MAKIKRRWTRLAIAGIVHAHEYLCEQSPAAATTIMQRVDRALSALQQHPEIGRLGRVKKTRELVITGTPFILCYRLKSLGVEILSLLHTARRWPDHF